ncbi:hypothetical protein CLHOM_08150 [Clostridium homopropionicum DSM 5847]|uniref:Glycoside-hydrolase family GH114 TIM-barrel domain-containing protein n=1 Tax=Clostridium homopropionicum DSM 5847 TaxID=1121318 RepID=A0A0L6ZCZ8_9CLOT|nr:putative glycoside hydrolase [Clostridium homopropionicum]KOA20673.1 hypothetical protein CLHOM_08150 [Clostridium homopropionicum DSM 5847]SFF91786.1 Endo alpha-1,4 polygalactosaminidase, GH114 family (was erroneously annotated as Cys-tRNA synthetase) [Clostridium homopropionicum]
MNIKNANLIIAFLLIIISVISYYKFIKNYNELNKVRSFKIYYGSINDSILEDMTKYELIIAEAAHFQKEDVDKIKRENSTILIGYLSVLEVGNWDKEILKKMDTDNFLKVNGKKVFNEKYNNYLGNIGQEYFRKVLISTLEERIISKGFDGVFLDTVDWVNYYEKDEEVYINLLKGYEELLKEVKDKFPNIYIIQNRGFGNLLDLSSKYVDGVLWENFKLQSSNDEIIRNQLIRLEKKKDISIFTVSFQNQLENQKLSEKLGWKYFKLENGGSFNKWQ